MEVYHQEKLTDKTYWLYFYFHNAIGVEWMDEGLPPPNFLMHGQRGVFIGWQIAGYPGTKKSQEYINDIIARFLVTFMEYKPERLPYRPYLKRKAHKDLKTVHELDAFQNLRSVSLPKSVQKRGNSIEHIDQIFWAIKNWVEAYIKQVGEGVPVPYETLENWAMQNFITEKERSTIRAKCRNVWRWYEARNWTIPERREFEMTRSERARKNAELKKMRARAAILGFLHQNLFANEYQRKDGSWNVLRISRALKMCPKTVRKHLRELREAGELPEPN